MVSLPSQSGLSPNLSHLLALPAKFLARHESPAAIALLCEGISSGLLLASQSAPEGDLCGAEDLADAAVWFAKVSTKLRGAVQ